ncbi:MAG: PilZ domain-containing protein [Thermoanaerobaculia bacterium]
MRERRRHERVPFITEARIELPAGPRLKASTTDLSEGGVGLFSPLMIAISRQVRVSFELCAEGGPYWTRPLGATVVRCQIDCDGNRIALEFDQLVSDSGDQQLAAALAHALARQTRVA